MKSILFQGQTSMLKNIQQDPSNKCRLWGYPGAGKPMKNLNLWLPSTAICGLNSSRPIVACTRCQIATGQLETVTVETVFYSKVVAGWHSLGNSQIRQMHSHLSLIAYRITDIAKCRNSHYNCRYLVEYGVPHSEVVEILFDARHHLKGCPTR